MDFTEDELKEIRAESQRAYDLDRAHVSHSWSAQKQLTPHGRVPCGRQLRV